MSKSTGEFTIQEQAGSLDRAQRFYDRQVTDHLTDRMREFIRNQEMVFIATADAQGHCDCSPRFGQKGFVRIINDRTLAFPDYRGNGVFASLGNIHENPHIGLVFIDFFDTTVGLHVNGRALIQNRTDHPLAESKLDDSYELEGTIRLIERWVVVEVEEAYIHCSKHVPHLQKLDKSIHWGTDDPQAKSENFFCHPNPTSS